MRLFVCSFFIACLSIAQVHAADTTSIRISPSSESLYMKPGERANKAVTVINASDSTYTARYYTTPYAVDGKHYTPRFTQDSARADASKWITLTSTNTNIRPQSVTDIKYSISVPDNTPSGGYYAVIFAESAPGSKNSTEINAYARVGSIIYITVTGDALSTIGTFEPLPAIYFMVDSTKPFAAEITNNGNTHFLANVAFTLSDIFGREVFTTHRERYVLPVTTRYIEADSDKTPLFGIYTLRASAQIGGKTQTSNTSWIILFDYRAMIIFVAAISIAIYLWKVRPRHQRITKT